MSKLIALKPRLSEKAYGLTQSRNTYVFQVPLDANKHTIAAAVAAQFEVTVENVNMTTLKGKTKKAYRKNGKATVGKRNDIKKAYVTLAEGQSLPFYEAEEAEDAKAAEQAAKEEKKADDKPRRGLTRRKKEEDK